MERGFLNTIKKKTESSAKWTSIKNRLTKSKSGFYALENKIPPDGFYKLYSHISWNLSVDPVFTITVPQSPPSNLNQINLNQIKIEEIIPLKLLANQPNVWITYTFNAHKFLDDMRSLSIYAEMNEDDKLNFKILLAAENDNSNELSYDYLSYMPTKALHDFGVRFGPWESIVLKVREFVSDGARDWFIGKCNRYKAEDIISQSSNCYCIRSVSPDREILLDHTYIFALSTKDEKISHLRIFKDKQHRICVINEEEKLQYFSSFKEFIVEVTTETFVPVGDYRFKDLIDYLLAPKIYKRFRFSH